MSKALTTRAGAAAIDRHIAAVTGSYVNETHHVVAQQRGVRVQLHQDERGLGLLDLCARRSTMRAMSDGPMFDSLVPAFKHGGVRLVAAGSDSCRSHSRLAPPPKV